jgi:hypothetical protein
MLDRLINDRRYSNEFVGAWIRDNPHLIRSAIELIAAAQARQTPLLSRMRR